MFKHQGKNRTLSHNLRIATILSFVAGIVNATGFLAFTELTTNVTGHFALFLRDVADFKFWMLTVYFLYIFSFLLGSFSSGLLIELFKENKKLNVFVIPTVIEILILIAVAFLSHFPKLYSPDVMVCLLLFAMGLQNSFVTKLSNAVVRTTHLTGLFTDLGIELSQLLFPKAHPNRKEIKSTVKLRLFIICFFFLGGLVGGFFYSKMDWKLNTLLLGALILIISLLYDDSKLRFIRAKRRFRQGRKPVLKFRRRAKVRS
ncbi:YoaK family protein [Gelidibacter mesophilus]|uniref:YoaK family protein n=1 Tax=Gelidibacter mesophilus TaxID=169050 RepID=UPI0003F7A6FD|nr:YoaK family protein [Gelidibacter mesophilus]